MEETMIGHSSFFVRYWSPKVELQSGAKGSVVVPILMLLLKRVLLQDKNVKKDLH